MDLFREFIERDMEEEYHLWLSFLPEELEFIKFIDMVTYERAHVPDEEIALSQQDAYLVARVLGTNPKTIKEALRRLMYFLDGMTAAIEGDDDEPNPVI